MGFPTKKPEPPSEVELAFVKEFPGTKDNPQGPTVYTAPVSKNGKYGEMAISRSFAGWKLYVNKGSFANHTWTPIKDKVEALTNFHKLAVAFKNGESPSFNLTKQEEKMAKKEKKEKVAKEKKVIDKAKIKSIKAKMSDKKAEIKTKKAELKESLKEFTKSVKADLKELKVELKAAKKGK